LQEQFDRVRLRTSDNFTFNMGSHTQRFGDLRRVSPEIVADYIGHHHIPVASTAGGLEGLAAAAASAPEVLGGFASRLPQREADLLPLRLRVHRAEGQEAKQAAQVGGGEETFTPAQSPVSYGHFSKTKVRVTQKKIKMSLNCFFGTSIKSKIASCSC
jgi:hypothetical protein